MLGFCRPQQFGRWHVHSAANQAPGMARRPPTELPAKLFGTRVAHPPHVHGRHADARHRIRPGLMIATYDRSGDWQENQFAQLRQRGVEGVIALQAELPLPAGFPAVAIDAIPTDGQQPITLTAHEALTILGRKAAFHVVRKIEQASRRLGGVVAPRWLKPTTVDVKDGTAARLAS